MSHIESTKMNNRITDLFFAGHAMLSANNAILAFSASSQPVCFSFSIYVSIDIYRQTNFIVWICIGRIGEPSAPYNCTVNNITSNGLSINCLPGYDGGLTQSFNLQVLQAKADNRIVFNATGHQSGDFNVYSLEPATSYELHIWTENTKGRSSSVHLMAET